MWCVSLLSATALAEDPDALGPAHAAMTWESDSHVRFASTDARVAKVAFAVSLAYDAHSVRWDQPLETVGIAPLMVPVELPTEPVGEQWPEGQRVGVLVSGQLVDGEGSVIGVIEAPLRHLVWSSGSVRLLPENMPGTAPEPIEPTPTATPRARGRRP